MGHVAKEFAAVFQDGPAQHVPFKTTVHLIVETAEAHVSQVCAFAKLAALDQDARTKFVPMTVGVMVFA